MRIGFIGLGTMGGPMAGHLYSTLGNVTVWNRTAARADSLKAKGATVAPSPADVAEVCDVICLCVADTPDVEAVMFHGNGVYTTLSAGKLMIDFSTISAAKTEEFATRVAQKGCSWIDAPVSGGDVGARNATLAIMAGGTSEDFQRALPIFNAVGGKIHHMGPVTSTSMSIPSESTRRWRFRPFTFFPAPYPPFPPGLGHFDRLRIDDASRGGGLASLGGANSFAKDGVDFFGRAVIAPRREVLIHLTFWREIVRDRAPVTARA